MKLQYFCHNKHRRVAVAAHPTLNGIDYLEVLDRQAPEGSPRQQTLLVRCLKEVPGLTATNVRIEGGVRVSPVRVTWAFRADAIPADRLTPAEQAYFAGLPQPERLLVVRTDAPGDYSPYRLLLVRSAADDAPPEDFDPQLREVEFSFKVECPDEFDCREEQVCPPEPLSGPPINYLAKDYSSFRRLMLDRLSAVMPDWQERNPADVGIALVEVLAYAADHLSYYQDAVATEAYLGTARRRVSLRRHARLLDYRLHEGCNARAWVTLQVDGAGDGLRLKRHDPAGGHRTRFLTRTGEPRVIHPDDLEKARQEWRPLVFEPLHDLTLYQAHNRIAFYTWGDDRCCLPRGATRATLKDDPANRLRLRPGDVLIIEEQRGPETGLEADADPAHRQAVRLVEVKPEATLVPDGDGERLPGDLLTDPLTGQAVVEIRWHREDALTFPLCLSEVVGGELKENISVALGNVVLADHGLTLEHQPLQPETVPETGTYRPELAHRDITHRIPYRHKEAGKQPAGEQLIQEPREALPAVELVEDTHRWNAVGDLLSSSRFARDVVVEMEDDRRALLRFGDGLLGRAPVPGTRFLATYRVGNGEAGNVGAEAIYHVVTPLAGIVGVRNPLPATGGVEPEAPEQGRLYAPYAFRRQQRAVTEADYARMCQDHPEVQKAVARFRWTGSWYTVFITVDRRGGLPVDGAFEGELVQFLERFRLAGHDLEIEPPRFVPLDVVLTVCVAPGHLRSEVKRELLQVFSNRDLPGGRRGFFHPDNFTFGQPVYLSQIVAAAMQVPGVAWVDTDDTPPSVNRFRRRGEPSRGEVQAGRIEMHPLEIARVDNDPNRPENGRIDFVMKGEL
ncbi:MAG: putative baseplate assembly protein [Calditrichaeota bacterium]|nr:MAG: putative baseplate assembly protein [Calditrichota bacterium]